MTTVTKSGEIETVVKTDMCHNGEWYQHVLPVLTYLFAFHIIILFKPKIITNIFEL